MDTKDKRREDARQREAAQQRRKRPAQPESGAQRSQDTRKTASRQTAQRRESAESARQRPQQYSEHRSPQSRPAERPAPEQTREKPRQRPAREQETRRPAREQETRRPAKEQESRQARPARNAASVERPRPQGDGMRASAPQGTGPRKSAPQMNAREAEALRRQQRQKQKNAPASGEKKNALQNFISGIRDNGGASGDAAEKARQRRKERAAKAERKKQQAQRYDTPAVIYTQPKVFNRDRLLLQLLTVTAVVAAFVIGMSVFFKVDTIQVAGAETYDSWTVREASGISEGDNLLTFSKAKASAKIQAELGFVNDVRIGIKLPDTVIIYIEEAPVSYAISSSQGDMWLINSDGKVAQQITQIQAGNYTKIEGVVLENPSVGSQAVAADRLPAETVSEEEATTPTQASEAAPITVTGAQRLASALQILKALEANDIVGEAQSIDVSQLDDIVLRYGSQYEVLLGDTSKMEYKIACMNDVILQMSDYQAGILDISFTTWPDQVGYTPFG